MGLRRIPSEVRACQWEEMAYSLQYKPIRHINLRLQVPTGQIRITAPFGVSEASIGAFLAKNREWIRIISFGPRPLNFLACNAPIYRR